MIRPFSCGSQYGDWTDANCQRCRKGADPANPPTRCACDIEQALLEAYVGEGAVPETIAERMGYERIAGQLPRYNWPCKELEIVR